MDWIKGFQKSIDYIDAHLTDEVNLTEIAREMHVSAFYYQKIFSILCGFTVGEYIRNRRLASAGSELAHGKSCGKIIDLAVKYGYDTAEGFTRAFTKFHGAAPSAVRQGAPIRYFAKLSVQITVKGGCSMNYQIVKKQDFYVLEKVEKQSIEDETNRNTIPEFWSRAKSDGTTSTLLAHALEDGTKPPLLFGICWGNSLKASKDFDYSIAVECDKDCAVPEGFRLSKIPARTWAIFPCRGAMPDAIQQAWHTICAEFFPSSNYQPTYEMDIEVYPAGDMTDSDYQSEIWVAIQA